MSKPIPHGTISGYGYHKCRCDECRQAKSDYGKQNKQIPRKLRQPKRHGTITAYNHYGCRCEECKQAARDYHATYEPKGEAEHGTMSGYVLHKCRCYKCKKAARDYRLKNKQAAGWTRQKRKTAKHGTYSMYVHHKCRCDPCKVANNEQNKRRKRRPMIEAAMVAFSQDPIYVVRMCHAAEKIMRNRQTRASSSSPQEQ